MSHLCLATIAAKLIETGANAGGGADCHVHQGHMLGFEEDQSFTVDVLRAELVGVCRTTGHTSDEVVHLLNRPL